jgi:sec-independent protein translocase protein TatC
MIKSEQIVDAVQVLNKYRIEIIKQSILLIIIMIIIYFNSSYIINVLSKPLSNLPLFFLTPMEGVMVKMKIAIVSGITLYVPLLAYRIIFLASAKGSDKNRKMLYFLIFPFAIVAFTTGVIFTYILILPTTIDFLISSGNEFMKPTISGGSYFSFVTIFLVGIGAVFELPLVFVILSKFGIVTYSLLSKKRKISILLIVIAAALITPTPDIFSLIIVALPMVALYEISIWWIFILEKSNKKKII